MTGMLDGAWVHIAGQELVLLPERAVYWPERGWLIVADVHLGKDGCFRRHGVAVPAGSDGGDLARLAHLATRLAARRLVVLGDLFHCALPRTDPLFDALGELARRFEGHAIDVVRGNHDRGIGADGPDLRWHEGVLDTGALALTHELDNMSAIRRGGGVLCGHLHPVVVLRGSGDRLRRAAFWCRPSSMILPAFGRFTGGHVIRPAPTDRIFVPAEQRVVDCTALFARGRARQSQL